MLFGQIAWDRDYAERLKDSGHCEREHQDFYPAPAQQLYVFNPCEEAFRSDY